MLIKWKEEYNTGFKEIDEQHRHIADVTNDLYEIMQKGEINEKIQDLFNDIISSAKEHFALEEKYFDEFGFEDTENHKRIHGEFLAKVSDLHKDIEGREIEISFELVDYLEDWFLDHLTTEDRKYIELFKSHGLT
ncbi:bacteriohemerythrin [Patescibacteria group bacterium]